MATQRRGTQTVADMVRSLGLVVAAVAVVVVGMVLSRPDDDPVREVDYEAALERARGLAPYDVAAPAEIPDGWRATSARLRETSAGVTWSLGFVTPDEQFVGVEQAEGDPERVVRERLDGWVSEGTRTLTGAQWARWVEPGSDPDRALVQAGRGVTTIVIGTVSFDRLEDFAAQLR